MKFKRIIIIRLFCGAIGLFCFIAAVILFHESHGWKKIAGLPSLLLGVIFFINIFRKEATSDRPRGKV